MKTRACIVLAAALAAGICLAAEVLDPHAQHIASADTGPRAATLPGTDEAAMRGNNATSGPTGEHATATTSVASDGAADLDASGSGASAWSPPTPLSHGQGAIGSPGGTHPLVVDGKNVHFVWWDDGNIHYRRSADGGATWTDDAKIVSGGKAVYPCSLELSGRTLHLIWPDKRNAGDWEVYYKRSDDGGTTWGPETRLTPGVDLFRMGTTVSGAAVHVVWFNKSLLEKVPAGEQTWTWTWGEVYYKRSTDGGVTWEKDLRLTQPDSTACRPGVAADGRFVHVCWLDRRDLKGEHPWQWKIWYKRSEDGGATWGPDVRMSDSPAHARHPQIVSLPEGQVCLIWEDGQIWEGGQKWSGDAALHARISKDNGRTWGEAKRITFVNSPHGHATHSKAAAAGRRIHLTWMDALPGSVTEPIQAQAAYYTTSHDGGLTWQASQQLPRCPGGYGEALAASGTETSAVQVLGQSGSIYVTTRPVKAPDPSTTRPAGH